jgi:uncharacterized cofD-like protein
MGQTKKILTIGGGSGQFTLLSGLRELDLIDITSVVSMFDSGGSTGRLRRQLGVLPPGDAVKCVLALSPFGEIAEKILLKKFKGPGSLEGHHAGNLLLTMLSRQTGCFPTAVQALAEILEIRGRVLPVTTEKATLVAELSDGRRIFGETAIDRPNGEPRQKIKNLLLVPHHGDKISVYPPVLDAISASDYIVIGPGDLFTSVIACLILPGIKEALQRSSAKIIYIMNIMTKFGETHGFNGSDFVQKVEECVGRRMDGIIYNTKKPDPGILKLYADQKAEFVEFKTDQSWTEDRVVYACNLLAEAPSTVRHDSKKLAALIKAIVFREEPQ